VLLTVVDNCIPSILGTISITNEGDVATEYSYFWWITPRASGQFADPDTVDSGSASKLVDPDVTFSTQKSLTLRALGTFWYKVKVYYGDHGDRLSVASIRFDSMYCDDPLLLLLEDFDENDTEATGKLSSGETPGFELPLGLLAIGVIWMVRRKKR
jgi:hypothetical protein